MKHRLKILGFALLMLVSFVALVAMPAFAADAALNPILAHNCYPIDVTSPMLVLPQAALGVPSMPVNMTGMTTSQMAMVNGATQTTVNETSFDGSGFTINGSFTGMANDEPMDGTMAIKNERTELVTAPF